MKYDIFVSYSRKDLALVQPLVEELNTMGMKVWFDMNGIESGDEFDEKIILAINDSDSVMFMYSENSIQSEWTKKEVQYAKRQGKTIRPVLISGSMPTTGWFTFHYGSIDCIDLTNHIPNRPGSYCTSLGKNHILNRRHMYTHPNIPCYVLKGVDSTNSNAQDSSIYIHPDVCQIPTFPFPLPWRTLGCFGVSQRGWKKVKHYEGMSPKTMLLWAYK